MQIFACYCQLKTFFLFVIFSIGGPIKVLYMWMPIMFDLCLSMSLNFPFSYAGSAPTGTEAEQEEETDACDSGLDTALQKSDLQNNEEENPASALPKTPLQLGRFSF